MTSTNKGTSTKVRVSEARLNDMAYIVLKRYFFEPALGTNPRQCDIRVVMDLTAPERITSPLAAILSPNETAPASHDVFYEVDPAELFDHAITYIEDHWVKAKAPAKLKKSARKEWLEVLWPEIALLPEEDCGPDTGKEGG